MRFAGGVDLCQPAQTVCWLDEWCFTPLSTVFQSYQGDSSHYSCFSWVSPVLAGALMRTLPRKNLEDTVRLEPRTPGLQVKHFTTEPRKTPPTQTDMGQSLNVLKESYYFSLSPFQLPRSYHGGR